MTEMSEMSFYSPVSTK